MQTSPSLTTSTTVTALLHSRHMSTCLSVPCKSESGWTCGGRQADLHVHSATPTGAASSHVQKYLLVGPSVWGRKSQRGLAGAAVPGATSPLLEQWEPALIG
ncbi:hypothetical protein XENOCAPTIV_020136 [Xenoophorus captivus]|uniref:Uncharacterized protein n=1 Tax=Xenoophorus captivus TaxID=1517983 RepID=A0ABV0QMB7_9TELE